MFGLGHTEILIIAVVILFIFGGKKIPELMRGIGEGIRSLRKGVEEETTINHKGVTHGKETKEGHDR